MSTTLLAWGSGIADCYAGAAADAVAVPQSIIEHNAHVHNNANQVRVRAIILLPPVIAQCKDDGLGNISHTSLRKTCVAA